MHTDEETNSIDYATRLHNAKIAYRLFAVLDSLNVAQSTLKLPFDFLYASASPDRMHEWLMTPAGITVAATESIALISLAILASYFDDDSSPPHPIKKGIVLLYPFVRKALKAAKNAYRGLNGLFMLLRKFNLLDAAGMQMMFTPTVLILGALSVANQCWFQAMINARKDMMRNNTDMFSALRKGEAHLFVMQKQNMRLRIAAYASALFTAIMGSLYWYVGVLLLAFSAGPVALMVLTVCAAIYSLAAVLGGLYEEWNNQQKLVITQLKIELAEMSNAYKHEQTWGGNFVTLDMLRAKRQKTYNSYICSYPAAVIVGLKNGLAVYGMLTSAMFLAKAACVLFSLAFPVWVLMGFLSSGIICLLACIVHAMVQTYREHACVLEDVYGTIVPSICEKDRDNILQKGMDVSAPVRAPISDGSEVWRMIWSGAAKASKGVEYTMNPLQESGLDGHYHDSKVMMIFSLLLAPVYAAVFGLRAYARGFGKPPIDTLPPLPKVSNHPNSLFGDLSPLEEEDYQLNSLKLKKTPIKIN